MAPKVFSPTMASATPTTQGSTGASAAGCTSSPIEMKNKLLSRSRSGRISAWIWWLNSLSSITRPARNAPTVIDNPRTDASHAVPRLATSTISPNASRPDTVANRNSSGSRNRVAAVSETATTASWMSVRPRPGASVDPNSTGANTRATRASRSCSSRMPTARLPWGACTSFLRVSSRTMIEVFEMATKKPTKSAVSRRPPSRA